MANGSFHLQPQCHEQRHGVLRKTRPVDAHNSFHNRLRLQIRNNRCPPKGGPSAQTAHIVLGSDSKPLNSQPFVSGGSIRLPHIIAVQQHSCKHFRQVFITLDTSQLSAPSERKLANISNPPHPVLSPIRMNCPQRCHSQSPYPLFRRVRGPQTVSCSGTTTWQQRCIAPPWGSAYDLRTPSGTNCAQTIRAHRRWARDESRELRVA